MADEKAVLSSVLEDVHAIHGWAQLLQTDSSLPADLADSMAIIIARASEASQRIQAYLKSS